MSKYTDKYNRVVLLEGKEVIYMLDSLIHQSTGRDGYVDSFIEEAHYLLNGEASTELNERELVELLDIDSEYILQDWDEWRMGDGYSGRDCVDRDLDDNSIYS